MYNWAISRELLESNPCAQISAPGEEHRRDRVLTDDEIRTIWKDLDNEQPRMAAVFRLGLINAQRGGEVAAMEARELDLPGGWWTIPGYKSKNGLAHRVPLTPPALKILEHQLRRTGELGYLFSAPRAKGQSPTSKFDLTKATERIPNRTGIKDFKAHD